MSTCGTTHRLRARFQNSYNPAARSIRSRTGSGLFPPVTHQHVVSAGVECQTELWVEPEVTGAWNTKVALEVQSTSTYTTIAATAAAQPTAALAGELATQRHHQKAQQDCFTAVHVGVQQQGLQQQLLEPLQFNGQPVKLAPPRPSEGDQQGQEQLQQHLQQQQQLQSTALQIQCSGTEQQQQQRQLQQLQSPESQLQCSTPDQQEWQLVDPMREYHKDVVRSLRSCSSLQQLEKVVEEHGPQMDHISVTSCFSAAARLYTHSQQWQQQQQMGEADLQEEVQKHTQVQHQRAFVTSVPQQHPHDQLQQQLQQQQHEPVQQWVALNWQQQEQQLEQQSGPGPPPLLQHTQQHVNQQQQQQEKQKHKKYSGSSLRSELHRLLQQLLVPLLQPRFHQLDAVGLVLVLHCLAVLGLKDEALLAEMEHAAVPLSSLMSPRLLSQLVWCFGQLDWRPQQQLLRRLLLHSGRQLQQQQCNSQDCAQLLHGLARLQQQPPQQWMQLAYNRIGELADTQQLHPTALCIILHSCTKLSPCPPTQLLQQLLAYAQPLLPSLSPPRLNMLAHALLLMKTDPKAEWQSSFVAAAQAVMGCCDGRNLAVLAAPLLRWRCVVADDWVQQYLSASKPLLQDMQPQGLAVLGHSLAGLHVLPPGPWRLNYLAAAHASGLASTPAGCGYLAHTLAAWQFLQAKGSSRAPPGGKFWDRGPSPVVESEVAGVGGCTEAAASGAAGSGACTDAVSGVSAVADKGRAGSVAAGQGQHLLEQQHRRSHEQLVDALTQQCLRCFMAHGSTFTAEQLGMFCRGIAGLRLQGNLQLAQQLNRVALALLRRPRPGSTPTAATLANLLLALVVCCPIAATQPLLAAVWAAQARLMFTVTPAHAAAVAWAASRLPSGGSSCGRNSGDGSGSRSGSSQAHFRQDSSSSSSSSSAGSAGVRQDSSSRGSLQPPARLIQQLTEHVALTADEATLQQLAVLLLAAERAGWQLETRVVQVLVTELLKKQAAALKKCSCSMRDSRSSSSSSSSSSGCCSTDGCSRSQRAQIWLANHRLKSCLEATAAVAAWSHALGPRSRLAALRNCRAMARMADSSTTSWLAVHVYRLASGDRSSTSSDREKNELQG